MQRRRRLVLTGIGVLTVTGAGLAFAGVHAVRTSTAGRYEQAAEPDDAGYQAYVVPTPTMGVLHRGDDGGLVGVALLALEPGDDGGSVVVVPPSTIVPDTDRTIADEYAAGGAEAASEALGLTTTVGVSEVVEVDDARWAQLVERSGAVEVTVDEAVGDWPAGPVTLDPEEVGPFLAALGDGETDLDRIDRQQVFWNAWLPNVRRGGEDVLPGEVGTGIGRFVLGVARGGGAAAVLPVARVDDDDGDGGGDDDGDAGSGTGGTGGTGGTAETGGGDGANVRFSPDGLRLGELVARTVPYPVAAQPQGRIRVRLLNGTPDDDITATVARTLVAGGAQISIVGNASSFDVEETTVVYTGEDRAPVAEWLGGVLGGSRVEAAPTGQDGQVSSDDEIDVTVILGDDAGDLIGEVADP